MILDIYALLAYAPPPPKKNWPSLGLRKYVAPPPGERTPSLLLGKKLTPFLAPEKMAAPPSDQPKKIPLPTIRGPPSGKKTIAP